MNLFPVAPILLLACSLGHAAAPCAPLRVGYTDQERAPYYMGQGTLVPELPGASVELIRKAAGADCPVQFVRLPTLRLRGALESGAIDVVPLDPRGDDLERFMFPQGADGAPDKRKAVHTVSVVFVRAGDGLPAETEPLRYFSSHVLGVIHGAPIVGQLRQAGLRLDQGALDAGRNLDKLAAGRIDGFAVALSAETDLDAFVRARHGKQLVRLARPLGYSHVWLAANKDYYDANRDRMTAVWRWMEAQGQTQLTVLMRKYKVP
ncbi:MAG: hypothetical protein V4724_40330 [Pseudomonadota bacterium]